MTEEREIVGIALPLAAGIASGFHISGLLPSGTGGTLAFATLVFFILLLHYGIIPRKSIVTVCIIPAFLCGIICNDAHAATNSLRQTQVSSCPREGIISGTVTSVNFGDKRTAPLLTALIAGDKTGLDKETRASFNKSGASHLLALSGLHLGIIYLFISRCLSLLGNSICARYTRSAITIILSGWYTIATGASPSLTRAFISITLKELSQISGRPQTGSQIVMSAMTIQLMTNPPALFSVGFQLSYLAVAGIVYINPIINKCWTPPPASVKETAVMKKIWDAATVSISCQAATAPVAWLTFGTFPSYFLLANIMAVPLTGILMPSAILTIILSGLDICPDILVGFTESLCILLLEILRIISVM